MLKYLFGYHLLTKKFILLFIFLLPLKLSELKKAHKTFGAEITFRIVTSLKTYFISLKGYNSKSYLCINNWIDDTPTTTITHTRKKASKYKLCDSTSPSSDKILNT